MPYIERDGERIWYSPGLEKTQGQCADGVGPLHSEHAVFHLPPELAVLEDSTGNAVVASVDQRNSLGSDVKGDDSICRLRQILEGGNVKTNMWSPCYKCRRATFTRGGLEWNRR